MRILHVFRSPVGGLFRHVSDLVRGQTALGHDVGILCDSSTGGAFAESLLTQLASQCALGVIRKPISRFPGIGDVAGVRATRQAIRYTSANIVHGHGAKGGVYARVAGKLGGITSLYTPHGGSLHYRWGSASGVVFLTTEMLMARLGSGFCFVCDFEQRQFEEKIGTAGKPSLMVHNGLWPEEFIRPILIEDATDYLFIGELRAIKGVDILLHALATLPHGSLTVVGDGADEAQYQDLAKSLGLAHRVRFVGRKTLPEAVKLGRIMVLPSRNESFPYVVLEAASAFMPLIASAVGDIAEVVPAAMLFPRADTKQLARLMADAVAHPAAAKSQAERFAADVQQHCKAEDMCRKITGFYATLLN